MMRFVSIDPGTIKTGVALWEDQQLLAWHLIGCRAKTRPFMRIGHISDSVQRLVYKGEADLVACEQVIHIEGRPNNSLGVLKDDIKSWVAAGRKEWVEYHPSTVQAAVRPRGFSGRVTKQQVRVGVQMLYGIEVGDLDQNVIDAIAVGHCHIEKIREQELVGR